MSCEDIPSIEVEANVVGVTPFHTAAMHNDLDTLIQQFENGERLPEYIPGCDPSPLAIACEAPANPRMATLQCLHGADPLLELEPGMLSNIPLLIATKLNTIGETEKEYFTYYSCVTLYIQTIMLAHEFGKGMITETECMDRMKAQTIKKTKWCDENQVKYDEFEPTAKSYLQE